MSCLFSFITYASDLCAKPFIRDTMSLNFGWQFHYGDEHGDWQEVDLPHDFQISQPWVAPGQDEKVDTRDAAANFASTLSARAFKELGTGWYRRNLDIDDSMKGKRLVLSFEGIMLVGDVYLDGERIGGTDYGYLGFEIDITDKVKYGASHELMVRADTMGPFNSRWYTGGGLFRDVNLVVTPKNGYFTRHPLHIRTVGFCGKENCDAQVAVSAGIWQRSKDSLLCFTVRVLDACGKEILEQHSEVRYKRYQRGADYDLGPVIIPDVRLWS